MTRERLAASAWDRRQPSTAIAKALLAIGAVMLLLSPCRMIGASEYPRRTTMSSRRESTRGSPSRERCARPAPQPRQGDEPGPPAIQRATLTGGSGLPRWRKPRSIAPSERSDRRVISTSSRPISTFGCIGWKRRSRLAALSRFVDGAPWWP